MHSPANDIDKRSYSVPAPSPRQLASRLYGFIYASLGERTAAELLIRKGLGRPASGQNFHQAVKKLLPALLAAGNTPQENLFHDVASDARLTWALQILQVMEPADRIMILMRDQLEWNAAEIASCFDISGEEALSRLRQARHHFVRQKEVLLNRRKRRR